MKLYKNVPIEDLESILKEGILPISKTHNNNWENSNRAENPIDLVYLFSPLTEKTSFHNYGLALLEIEINESRVIETVMQDCDVNKNLYREFITTSVPPECIKTVFIPKIFKNKIKNIKSNLIYWCEVKYLDNYNQSKIDRYLETVKTNISEMGYLKGLNEDGEYLEIKFDYIIKYKFNKSNYESDYETLTDVVGFNFITFGENSNAFFIKSNSYPVNLYIIDNKCKLPKNFEILATFKDNLQIFGQYNSKKLLELCYKKMELIKMDYSYILRVWR